MESELFNPNYYDVETLTNLFAYGFNIVMTFYLVAWCFGVVINFINDKGD